MPAAATWNVIVADTDPVALEATANGLLVENAICPKVIFPDATWFCRSPAFDCDGSQLTSE